MMHGRYPNREFLVRRKDLGLFEERANSVPSLSLLNNSSSSKLSLLPELAKFNVPIFLQCT